MKRQDSACLANCLNTAAFGGCSQSDDVCLCKNTAFLEGLYGCILDGCSQSAFDIMNDTMHTTCDPLGISLDISATDDLAPPPSGTAAAAEVNTTAAPESTAGSSASHESIPKALSAVVAVAMAIFCVLN